MSDGQQATPPNDPQPEMDTLQQLAREALQQQSDGQGQEGQPQPQATPQPQPQPPPTQPTFLRDYLRNEFGYDLPDEVTDEQIAPQLGDMISNHRRLEEERNKALQSAKQHEAVLQDYMRNAQAFHEWQQKQQQSQGSQNQPEDPSNESKWNPIQYNPDWEGRIKWDDKEGRFVPATQFDSPLVADEANKWYKFQKDIQRRVAADPWGLALEAGGEQYLKQLKQEIQQEIDKAKESILGEWQDRQVQAQAQNELETFFAQHAGDYFQLDEQGRVKINPVSGEYALTPKGQAYFYAEQEAQQVMDLKDPLKVHRYALRMSERVPNETPSPQPQSEPSGAVEEEDVESAEERNRQQKKRFLERKSDRPATAPSNAVVAAATGEGGGNGARGNSFLEMALSDPDNAEILGADFKG